jgi:hypothetical protein
MRVSAFWRAVVFASACSASLLSPAVRAQTAPSVAEPGSPDEAEAEVAPSAPPELPQESIPPAPFAGATWTSGNWYWDGDTWRFKPGAWIASLPGYRYVNGYWHQEGTRWRWMPGGWAQPGSLDVEIPVVAVPDEQLATQEAPPPARVETPPPAPAAQLVWAPGYWYWSGQDWAWIPGEWLARPHTGWVYVYPTWLRRGGAWVFRSGGWALAGGLHVVVPVHRHAFVSVGFGHPYYPVRSWWRHGPPYRSWGSWPAHVRDRPPSPVHRAAPGRPRHHGH